MSPRKRAASTMPVAWRSSGEPSSRVGFPVRGLLPMSGSDDQAGEIFFSRGEVDRLAYIRFAPDMPSM